MSAFSGAFVLRGEISPSDPGVRVFFGNPGSGKSHALSQDVIAAARFRTICVVDATEEWVRMVDGAWVLVKAIPPDVQVWGAFSADRALALLRAGAPGIIVYQPTRWIEDTTALLGAITDRTTQVRGAGIAISEAHMLAPNGPPLSPGFQGMATRWRHLHLAVWLDTQRPASLHRTVTELATVVGLFAVTGPRDADAVAELVNHKNDLLAANEEACRRLAAGESGWHVRLGINRSPPYTLVRV